MLLQEMQLIPLEYQPYSLEPWAVTLGTTSSTPEQRHAVLSIFFDSLCSNCTIDTGAIYAENIVVHDYTTTLNGRPAVGEHLNKLTRLPNLQPYKTLAVCQEDLCISYTIRFFDNPDRPNWLIWAALHRFEAGTIVEEWWFYDNWVVWHTLDW